MINNIFLLRILYNISDDTDDNDNETYYNTRKLTKNSTKFDNLKKEMEYVFFKLLFQ